MTHREFRRWLLFDVTAVTAVVVVGVLVITHGPDWLAGAIGLAVIPVAVASIFTYAAVDSRRRDNREAVDSTSGSPGGEPIPRGRDGRFDSGAVGPTSSRPLQPAAIHGHEAPQILPAAAPTTDADRPTLPGRSARPDVVTAWTEFAWATHHLSMHTYRVTRPGR